jgi:hypothetical protein
VQLLACISKQVEHDIYLVSLYQSIGVASWSIVAAQEVPAPKTLSDVSLGGHAKGLIEQWDERAWARALSGTYVLVAIVQVHSYIVTINSRSSFFPGKSAESPNHLSTRTLLWR